MLRLLALCATIFASGLTFAAETVLTEALSTRVQGGARSIIRKDSVEAQFVAGQGAAVGQFDGWTPVKAGADGWFAGPEARGGYLAFDVKSSVAKDVFVEAPGSGVVYIDGEPRAGDPYAFGYMSLPARLKQGTTHIVVQAGRGRVLVKLIDVTKPISLDLRDATLPDVVPGEKGPKPGSVVVRNATANMVKVVLDGGAGRFAPTSIPAYSIRKVGVNLPATGDGKSSLKLLVDGKVVDSAPIGLAVRKPGESFKVTFWSEIDGSVQYYAVHPSSNPGAGQALFLSLHGASVEALGQAQAYGPHSWGYVVCPTNRRPYGFDWEDAGRLDALEVLKHAKAKFKTDPRQTYLTGHSMGGHGTWQIGGHFPSLFAAIAPSAGWVSFNTYAGGMRYDENDPVQAMLKRAGNTSDTPLLKQNYWQEGVFVLHGDADDNVPVTEARSMRKLLEGHPSFQYHEVPGVSHWYDTTPDAGADCLDWPGIFDLFAHRRLPAVGDLRDIDFTTLSPGVSANCHWVTVLQQEHALQPSHVVVHLDLVARKITGTVDNVARLFIDTTGWGAGQWTLELKGQKPVTFTAGESLKLTSGGAWSATNQPISAQEKSPERSGGFKAIFNHRVVIVYGTHGSSTTNTWSRNLARFLGESMAYRGNGALQIVSDQEFSATAWPGRNVLLLGDRTSNSAFSHLVQSGDFDIAPGSVSFGDHRESGDDLAVFAIRPRADDPHGMVGVVAGTGAAGERLCDRAPYFTSGAAFPDAVVLKSSMLAQGAAGVVGGGFFANDWRAAGGDWVWR